MKINVTTDYAIRSIKSIYNNDGFVTSNKIAEKEGIPHCVLMKTLGRLKRGGLVISHQGRGSICGGFSLSKSIKEITILEVVELMEGPVNFDFSSTSENAEDNDALNAEYQRVAHAIRRELSKYTIYDIIAKPEENAS